MSPESRSRHRHDRANLEFRKEVRHESAAAIANRKRQRALDARAAAQDAARLPVALLLKGTLPCCRTAESAWLFRCSDLFAGACTGESASAYGARGIVSAAPPIPGPGIQQLAESQSSQDAQFILGYRYAAPVSVCAIAMRADLCCAIM